MRDLLEEVLEEDDFSVIERFIIPATEPQYLPIPPELFQSPVGDWLKQTIGDQLWSHQSLGIEKVLTGTNVVVSTGTASGKSLIFRAACLHRTLQDEDARILVFYPLKALSADQERGWAAAAEALGLPPGFIGRIDGGVSCRAREGILESARILLATPDVIHAYLMSSLSLPVVKKFVRRLSKIVLDEAHVLEGVFGSNFGYLFRRLATIHHLLSEKKEPLQVVAATATIASPTEHLKKLTGLEFESIDEQHDGSPHQERHCIHLASPVGEAAPVARSLITRLVTDGKEGGLIGFADSRKGVEVLATSINRELEKSHPGTEVLPYRAGLTMEERQDIEERLRNGDLKGVISTSALEMGIDIPCLEVGVNVSVPATRKAFLQRLGRVGRNGPGTFVLIAEPGAFVRYGTTFQGYFEMAVEPSYLYLTNRFMGFAHARCLADELDSIGVSRRKNVFRSAFDWPEGFEEIYENCAVGRNLPREFESIATMGGDTPQRNYPLRNVGELNLKIKRGLQGDAMGEVSLSQALRECYPGATYLHRARPFKVQRWCTSSFEAAVIVKPQPYSPMTKPRIRTWVNADLSAKGIVQEHYRSSDGGFLTECQMQITEKVEGYEEPTQDATYLYKDLREKNPSMKPRSRYFRTTGILLKIEDAWFRKKGIKNEVADWLTEIFCREYSVLAADIGVAATNITIQGLEEGRGHHVSNCIAIFDQTYGSLRLTERVFLEFSKLIDRMKFAAEALNGDAEKDGLLETASHLRSFELDLGDTHVSEDLEDLHREAYAQGVIQVFAAGSVVGFRDTGDLYSDIEIIQPAIGPDGSLMYQVKCRPKYTTSAPTIRWVSARHVDPVSEEGEWAYALWNPETQAYVDEGESPQMAAN